MREREVQLVSEEAGLALKWDGLREKSWEQWAEFECGRSLGSEKQMFSINTGIPFSEVVRSKDLTYRRIIYLIGFLPLISFLFKIVDRYLCCLCCGHLRLNVFGELHFN